MRKINSFLMVLMCSLSLFSASCSKDDDAKTDIRDNVVGTYNYTMKAYQLVGETLTYLGAELDQTGTMIVKKNTTSSTTIDMYEGGNLEFQCTKVAEASNGLVFDVASQTMTDPDGNINISGYEYWDLSGTKYHGAYISATKKLQIAFKYTTTRNGEQITIVAVYEGVKQ